MSGHFPAFPELQQLIEWLSVQPGDSARNECDDAAIRAHLNRWSHQWTPCWLPNHVGQEI